MDVCICNSLADFNSYFKKFKESARIASVPDIFVIGLDIEFICEANQKTSFPKSLQWVRNNENGMAACLLQISSSSLCMVINLVKLKNDLPNKLVKLLKSDSWVKLGVGIERDLDILSVNFNLKHCGGGIELKNVALMAKFANPNLENMYQKLVGLYVKKTSSICDWALELDEEKLTYAAGDALMSYQLGMAILEPSIKFLIEKKKDASNNLLKLNFVNMNEKKVDDCLQRNYIGIINEYAQKNNKPFAVFHEEVVENQKFKCECQFLNYKASGIGGSKKEAKQNACMAMWKILNK